VKLRRLKVVMPGLPEAFNGLKIGLVTDIHHRDAQLPPFLMRAFSMLRDARPDVLVIAGDISDVNACAFQAAQALAAIAPPLGAFFVPGNHDYHVWHAGMTPQIAMAEDRFAGIEKYGIRVLRNQTVLIERNGSTLPLVGLDDLWSGFIDADAAIKGIGQGPAIIVVHNPDALPLLDSAPPSLILSGHTHGGQVVVPFAGPPIVPVRNRRHVHGLYQTGRHMLYVSNGVGYLRRIRFNCRPEVVLLTLATAGQF